MTGLNKLDDNKENKDIPENTSNRIFLWIAGTAVIIFVLAAIFVR